MKEPDYYDPWEDSGGSSYLCECSFKYDKKAHRRKHEDWCKALNAPQPIKTKEQTR